MSSIFLRCFFIDNRWKTEEVSFFIHGFFSIIASARNMMRKVKIMAILSSSDTKNEKNSRKSIATMRRAVMSKNLSTKMTGNRWKKEVLYLFLRN